MNDPVTLAEVLDTERKRQMLSVNAVARFAEQSVGRVHSVLTGKTPNPSFGTVTAILSGLGRSLTWLDKQLKSSP